MFDSIVSFENIEYAYQRALKGNVKYTKHAMIFHQDETYNILKLQESLINGTYRFSGYSRFTVYEPKERIIDAPYFVDKVVQLAINNILKEDFNKSFITDTYACIDERGTHKCSNKIHKFLKQARFEYGDDAFIIKIDIKKFFYSIDRDILKNLLKRKIKCERTLNLIFLIIDSAKTISELGLPLGNTLSQLFANVYMNPVDQYAKRELSLKYYARYADDIVVVVRNKEEAMMTLNKLILFINSKIKLDVNESKTKIFPINQGVNSIGFKTYDTHKLLRDNSKRHIKRRLDSIPHLIKNGKLTVSKAEQMLNSWKGHADNACSHNFILSLINRYDFIYINKYGKLKIDERWL